MTLKGSGSTQLREIDRWDGGVGWMAYPEEKMQRASHALVVDDEVWLVDPVDSADLDEFLEPLGDVAGVVVTLDRHTRDATPISRRHDVPVYVSGLQTGIADELREEGATVERFGTELGDTGYEAKLIVELPGWEEIALYNSENGALLVPEVLGTADFFLAGEERLGVHPTLRLLPPVELADVEPDRILVCHGTGIHEGAPSALADAIDGSRRRAPSLWLSTLREFLPV